MELKEGLKRLGWSQAELSRRVGISENTITSWMKKGCEIPRAVESYVLLKLRLDEQA